MPFIEQRLSTKSLLWAMILLQLLWLTASGVARGSEISRGQNLFFLLCSAILGLGVFFLPERFVSECQRPKDRLFQNERLLIFVLCAVVFVAGTLYARYNKVFLDEPENFNASKKVIEEDRSEIYDRPGKLA